MNAIASACPVEHDLEPLSPDFLSDPFPYFAARRRETPVFYLEELDLYVVTRYADVERIFLDRDAFGAANASSPIWPLCPAAARIIARMPKKPTLNNADPPRHGPMRTAVLKTLTPRRIAAMEPALREVAKKLVSDLANKPVADLVEDLAFPLPGYAAFTLLGFPLDEWGTVKEWCRDRVRLTYGRLNDADQVRVAEAMLEFWQYCEQHVDRREREPADDVTSELVAHSAQFPSELTRDDIVIIVYALALAGHDTTTAALSSGLRRLLADRRAWSDIVAAPEIAPGAVDEMMRFDPPLMGHRRIALRDVEVGGVPVPAGSQLFLSFVSAHRDGDRFVDADAFDIYRGNARSLLSFGKGVHLCIGAPLARLEIKIALEVLAEVTPLIALVDQPVEMVPNLMFRNMRELLAYPGGAPAGGDLQVEASAGLL